MLCKSKSLLNLLLCANSAKDFVRMSLPPFTISDFDHISLQLTHLFCTCSSVQRNHVSPQDVVVLQDGHSILYMQDTPCGKIVWVLLIESNQSNEHCEETSITFSKTLVDQSFWVSYSILTIFLHSVSCDSKRYNNIFCF